MDVGRWLRSLGLEQYETAFRDNAIDDGVLPSLTAEDLKELGVVAVGHRRKLLDAIATLRTDASAYASPLGVVSTIENTARDAGERRQVTVMFSDLVGSTALSGRLDPEDLREVIAVYRNCATEIVRRFDGFIAQYLGDGVLVYFGYPRAHEDDAERAVQAGLELIAALTRLETHTPLRTRVGIATGLVVVGHLIASGDAQERGIVGETPNLAARLQGVAQPNTVVIAESTRTLLGSLFELQDLGALGLKGITEPVRAWVALRNRSVESRFEALRASGLTAFVGREEESELLLRRWSRAKAGDGQVVLLSGEAGIGKSRLTAALLERLAGEPHTRLRYFCSPQHADSTLYPIISQMQRAAGLVHDDVPQAKLDKLDALLAQTSTSPENAGLIAATLSLPNDGRYPALALAPEQRRQRTLEAIASQLDALTRQNPVLMIFEDAHWIDPTSLEVLGRTVDQAKTVPVLLIITFRHEFNAPWTGRSHVMNLALNRLGERETTAIIAHLAGNKQLPADVTAEIAERTDGIPLFVEEMTKAILEAKGAGEARQTAAAVPSPTQVVPASLHASLMARLDNLGPAKEVAQNGAAIGREFSHALLASVVRKPEAELASALDRLIAAGLLFRQGVPPHATYLFKHALVQDAAYGTLLREPRRMLHARIAETLESQFAAESQPEILARHFSEAGLIEKAASWSGRAGKRSWARSALIEAVVHFTRALEQIATLPGTPALRRQQIELQLTIFAPLSHLRGYAAAEPRAALQHARLLIEQAEAHGEPPDDQILFSLLSSSWLASYVGGDNDAARDFAVQLLASAEKQKAIHQLIPAHSFMGSSLVSMGEIAEGRAHFDQAVALCGAFEHPSPAAQSGQALRSSILSSRSLAQWLLGYPGAALRDTDDALKNAQETGQAASLLNASWHASMLFALCGNRAAATTRAEEIVALADDKGSVWRSAGTMLRGQALALDGSAVAAIEKLSTGATAYRATGANTWIPFFLAQLARSYAEIGEIKEAWHCIGEAMDLVETRKEKWCEAEIHRTAGDIALMAPASDAEKAQVHFEQALDIARRQQAKSWELRASTSLARLWCDQGEPDRALKLLGPVHDWFSEGFDTLDLKNAKSMLDSLHG